MSRYDGLIIPRSYNEYINKTDPVAMSQALQLSGVLSGAVAAGDNKAVTSNAVNVALVNYALKENSSNSKTVNAHSFIYDGTDQKLNTMYILNFVTDSSDAQCIILKIGRNDYSLACLGFSENLIVKQQDGKHIQISCKLDNYIIYNYQVRVLNI